MNCFGKTFDKKHKIDYICIQNQFEMSLGMLLQHPPKGEGEPITRECSELIHSKLKTFLTPGELIQHMRDGHQAKAGGHGHHRTVSATVERPFHARG